MQFLSGFYIHNRLSAHTGLQVQSWPEPVLHQTLEREVINTFTISKIIKKRLESKDCMEEADQQEYNECLLAWLRKEIEEDNKCQGY